MRFFPVRKPRKACTSRPRDRLDFLPEKPKTFRTFEKEVEPRKPKEKQREKTAKMLGMPGRAHQLASPLDLDALHQALAGDVLQDVVIVESLTSSEYAAVGAALAGVTDRVIGLAIAGIDDRLASLECLRWFPQIRRLRLTSVRITDLTALQHLSTELTELHIGETVKALDLSPAMKFQSLEHLRVVGHTKGLANLISANRGLSAIALWRIPFDRTLSSIGMPNVKSLALTLGSLSDSGWLQSVVAGLRYLALRQVRQLKDLSFLTSAQDLELLWLDTLSAITSTPDLSHNEQLTAVEITDMSSLRSPDALRGLALAPSLKFASFTRTSLPVEAFRPLAKKADLTIAISHTQAKQRALIQEMLPPPPPRFPSLEELADEREIPWVF